MTVTIKNLSPINMAREAEHITFGDVWYRPGGEYGPRVQADYQLVIVHSGEANVTFDGGKCTIPPGAVALMMPGRREHFYFSKHHRTHHTWCAIRPEAVPPSLRRRLVNLPAVLPQSPAFQLLMKAPFSLGHRRARGGGEMLRALGLTLLEEYICMAKAGADEDRRESPQARARDFLEEHSAEEDCLAGAARAAGVTPQHLIRLFREYYQISPGRYLWQLRVDRGVGLLGGTGLTVAEIADRCGFKNPFHFSRLMRQMQGHSPRAIRLKAWAKGREKMKSTLKRKRRGAP